MLRGKLIVWKCLYGKGGKNLKLIFNIFIFRNVNNRKEKVRSFPKQSEGKRVVKIRAELIKLKKEKQTTESDQWKRSMILYKRQGKEQVWLWVYEVRVEEIFD